MILDAKHVSAQAFAALARTEPSAVGGRAPSEEGRQKARNSPRSALALSPDSPDAHDVMGDIWLDALRARGRGSRIQKGAARTRRIQLGTNEACRSAAAPGEIR